MTLDRHEATAAYHRLVDTYCIAEPLPVDRVVPKLMSLRLRPQDSNDWIPVHGERVDVGGSSDDTRLGASQGEIDDALYGDTRCRVCGSLQKPTAAALVTASIAEAAYREEPRRPMTNHNPYCDCAYNGSCSADPEVRVLPTSECSNAILCRAHWSREIAWRREVNSALSVPYDLPDWESLDVYNTAD